MARKPHVENPKLRTAAPQTYWICWGYFYTNIFIGIGLYLTRTSPRYAIITRYTSLQFWGVVFILMALVGGVALLINSWHTVRRIMIVGLFVKSLWLYSLLFNFTSSILTVTAMFSFLAYVQLLTVMFFPEIKRGTH